MSPSRPDPRARPDSALGANATAPQLDGMMTPFSHVLEAEFGPLIAERDMRRAEAGLCAVAAEHGLGVAMLVAHEHGLRHEHIPLLRGTDQRPCEVQSLKLEEPDSPFVFAHVPIRGIRSNQPELIARGIMNPNPRTSGYIYHEDGLIGEFTFDLDEMRKLAGAKFGQPDLADILLYLEAQGILREANVNSRQVQFKNTEAKRTIDSGNQIVYVRGSTPIDSLQLPADFDMPKIKEHIISKLRFKGPCNYCSCRELNPRELTLDTAESSNVSAKEPFGSTERNYMGGYTFAPFGDPRTVSHFLAWDFPHLHEVVNNMDPQSYSFSDLIRLVGTINADRERFGATRDLEARSISGVCNHWAGNSIYHQHYQFFHIPDMPLQRATVRDELVTYRDVSVQRLDWPAPAYRISGRTADSVKDLMFLADKVADLWLTMGNGMEKDRSYGNGITIDVHTQNIFVSWEEGQPVAYFIPRLRTHLSTKAPQNIIQKNNAAVLEMLGYFLVDNQEDFEILKGRIPKKWFDRELSGSGVNHDELVAALQSAGYLDADNGLIPGKVNEGPLAIELRCSPEVLETVRAKLCRIPDSPEARADLARRWLVELSPETTKIEAFEDRLKLRLTEHTVSFEQRILAAADHRELEERKRSLMELKIEIERDAAVNSNQAAHLLDAINEAYRAKVKPRSSTGLVSAADIETIVRNKVHDELSADSAKQY